MTLSPGRGQRIALPGGVTLIDDAYNANPVSMRAALDELAATAARIGAGGAICRRSRSPTMGGRDGWRCSATCSSSAPTPRATTARSAPTRRRSPTCWSRVGPLAAAMADSFGGEHHHAADAARAAATLLAAAARRRHGARQGLERQLGFERVCEALGAAGCRLHGTAPESGRVLISGSAALLLCLFLSPKFIEFLRARSFGQNIREEGPEGHKVKAGTPTMGGIIIMIAFAVPYLVLSTQRLAVDGRVWGDDRMRAARVRRRLHEDRQAALARPAGADQADRRCSRSRSGLWWVATHLAQPHCATSISLRPFNAHVDLGPLYPSSSTWWSPARPTPSTSPTASTASPPAAPRSPCSPTSASRSSPAATTTSS